MLKSNGSYVWPERIENLPLQSNIFANILRSLLLLDLQYNIFANILRSFLSLEEEKGDAHQYVEDDINCISFWFHIILTLTLTLAILHFFRSDSKSSFLIIF